MVATVTPRNLGSDNLGILKFKESFFKMKI